MSGSTICESAVKFDKAIKGPRLELLNDAMHEDDVPDSNYWAKEVLNVDPNNLDAHYALALEALDNRTPNVPEARRHLEVLEKKKASAIRRALGPSDARRRDRRSGGREQARWPRLERSRSGPTRIRSTAWPGSGSHRMAIRVEADPARLDEQVQRHAQAGQGAGPGRGARPGSRRAAPCVARADSESL